MTEPTPENHEKKPQDSPISEPQNADRIVLKIIENEMKQSYLAYSMSVIVGRALPDVRDGLKPVHRRILYAMYQENLMHNKKYSKCAGIVGDVLKKFHPHGDSAVYEALVRLAQNWNLRYMLVDGQGNFGCFTADTKVQLTDGRNLSFLDLTREYEQGKKNYTFTSQEGEIKIAEILHPRKTKENAELVKITLDNGEEIKCTLNHKFLLKNMEYKEAKDLKPGESLMPLYSRLSTSEDDEYTVGYQMIYQPLSEKWSFAHHMADELNIENEVYTVKAGKVRHHKDFNKLNNNPCNIVRMQWKDHWMLHASLASQKHKNDPEYVKKLAEGRKAFWSEEENRLKSSERLSKRNIENWKKESYRQKMIISLSETNKKYIAAHPELREEFSKRASKTLKRMWQDPVYKKLFHEKIVAANKKRITNKTGKVKFLRICREAINKFSILNEENYEKTRKNIYSYGAATTWKIGIKKYFEENSNLILAELNGNHKVLKVEFLSERQDVYDITIEGTHNFSLAAGVFVHNSVDGDSAAAYRYTEARLSRLAEELLEDIDKETVQLVKNYDGTREEPMVLPSKLPNLLINGSSGIAVGMATNIPPHNINEICDAVIQLIENPNISIEEIMQFVQGPDFPTGGIICGSVGIRDAYKTGRGKIILRSKTSIEETKNKQKIIVTEIPYMVNKAQLLEQIVEQVRDKKIQGISDIRDESDQEGMRIVIELKTGANPEVVTNQLYTFSRMQESFGIIMLALDKNQPKILNLKEMLQKYLEHRQIIVRKRTAFDLRQNEDRLHLLEGIIIALNHIDPVITLLKSCKNTEEARTGLMDNYKLSEKQAQAILDIKLQRLTSLEQNKAREEHKELVSEVTRLKDILSSEQKILDIIKKELTELKEKYGDKRRTVIEKTEAVEIVEESMIKPEEMVLTVSHAGYIKRINIDVYKEQKRGGKGVIAAGTKEEDFIEQIFVANTHDYVLFFTNKGRVHWLKVHQVPEAGRYAKGTAMVNLVSLEQGENVTAYLPVKTFAGDKNLFMATKLGTVKKTSLEEFANPRKGGIIAITLDPEDELMDVQITDGKQEVILTTKNGQAVRFREEDVRPIGRMGKGVIGIRLKGNDEVVESNIADNTKTLLTLTKKGYGKRTEITEYSTINRGGSGVINIKVTDKNGEVVSVKQVSEGDSIMIMTKNGVSIRIPANGISVIGRSTQGVRVIRLDEDDEVSGAAIIKEYTNAKENGDSQANAQNLTPNTQNESSSDN